MTGAATTGTQGRRNADRERAQTLVKRTRVASNWHGDSLAIQSNKVPLEDRQHEETLNELIRSGGLHCVPGDNRHRNNVKHRPQRSTRRARGTTPVKDELLG